LVFRRCLKQIVRLLRAGVIDCFLGWGVIVVWVTVFPIFPILDYVLCVGADVRYFRAFELAELSECSIVINSKRVRRGPCLHPQIGIVVKAEDMVPSAHPHDRIECVLQMVVSRVRSVHVTLNSLPPVFNGVTAIFV
jgi:hypothetical protein